MSVKNALSVLLVAAALGAPAIARAQVKVGFVDIARVLRDAALAQRVRKKILADFAERERDLAALAARLERQQQDLQKNNAARRETEQRVKEREIEELGRSLERRRQQFQEDLNQRRNNELASLVEQTNKVVRQIADKENYDLISQNAVWASHKADLTARVIQALDAQ